MGVQTIRSILEAITNGDHDFALKSTSLLLGWGKSVRVCVSRVEVGGSWEEEGGVSEEAQ